MIGSLIAIVLLQAEEGDLGLTVRIPTPKEAREYSLPWDLKRVGMMVGSAEKGSPAERAGIRNGDVLLRLNENKLYSRDNVEDFLRVTPPGAEVRVRVKRAGTYEEEEIPVTLGRRKAEAKGIAWQFASLEQLDAALARAKKEKRFVLVGLSGAET